VTLPIIIPPAFHDQARATWRWRWQILGAAWGLAVTGWLAVACLPDQFQASTRIYVETDNLLTPLLRNITVQADLQNHVEVMQRTLLNRNNVALVARAAGLDGGDEIDKERIYQKLQHKITVTAEGRNLFSVSYRHADPSMAKTVVESLLTIFVDTNIGRSRSNMEGARTFIEGQIGEYEQQLKQAEMRLAEYKGKHVDVLAATGSNFSSRLEAVREEEQAARIKVDELTATRNQLRQSLAGVSQYVEVDSNPQVVMGAIMLPPQLRVQQMEGELAQLRARFTERHPDVIAATRALEAAQASAPRDGDTTAPGPAHLRSPSVVYEQLKLRLIQAEAELTTAHSRRQSAAETLQRLAAMGEIGPKVEAELADLNREYGVLKAKYEDLLGRRESARISEAVETTGDKLQFRVVEAPHVLLVPVWPNRPLFNTVAFVLAVLAALAAGFLLDRLDDTVHSAETIRQTFGIRVLGVLPKVAGEQHTRRNRADLIRFAGATACLFATYGLVVTVTHLWRIGNLMERIF
jgi:polysaccharide chain length determinant protein (PEP-CTERM system associated)